MTAATLPAAAVGPRAAWRSLLWIAPITLLWTLLIYWQPTIPESGVPSAAARLMAYAILGLGLWLGLERTDLAFGERRSTWLWVMIPYSLWFAIAWSAAVNGAFRAGPSSLPLLPLAIFGPVIVALPMLLLSRRVGQLLDAMPASWLVAIQLYRVFGSVFLVEALRGSLAGVFGLPAGVGDVLTGVFALPAAIAVSAGTPAGRRAAIAWNLLGLADLTVAITLGMITSPGPMQLIFPAAPSIGAGAYPNVLTPAFVVPSSILLHALSLRQLRRREPPR